jgi:hypothetical protein
LTSFEREKTVWWTFHKSLRKFGINQTLIITNMYKIPQQLQPRLVSPLVKGPWGSSQPLRHVYKEHGSYVEVGACYTLKFRKNIVFQRPSLGFQLLVTKLQVSWGFPMVFSSHQTLGVCCRFSLDGVVLDPCFFGSHEKQ